MRFGDGATRVLLAVVDGATTYAELIEATGLSRSTIHQHLHALRDEGLVDFDAGKQGTLRPRVTRTDVLVGYDGIETSGGRTAANGRPPAHHLTGGDEMPDRSRSSTTSPTP